MENITILNICMYLELYSEAVFSHDDIECGGFADACIYVLKKKALFGSNKDLLDKLKKVKGKTCLEIGEEKCNELFRQVKSRVNFRDDGLTEYVGAALAAEMLGCSQQAMQKLCREGKINGAEQDRPGTPWRIPRATIEEMRREKNNQ